MGACLEGLERLSTRRLVSNDGHDLHGAAAEQTIDHRRLCKFLIRLLHTPLPTISPDAAYLFHQTDANVDSVVRAGVRLLEQYPCLKLCILDIDNERLPKPMPFFGATKLLLERLDIAGVKRNRIILLEFDHSMQAHTLNESIAVVRFAKSENWSSLAVVAPSFHLPRAAMTMASCALRDFPNLQLHPVVGDALPWEQKSAHSQGMVGTRADFIDSELDRITAYTKKGDISSLGRIEGFFVASDLATELD